MNWYLTSAIFRTSLPILSSHHGAARATNRSSILYRSLVPILTAPFEPPHPRAEGDDGCSEDQRPQHPEVFSDSQLTLSIFEISIEKLGAKYRLFQSAKIPKSKLRIARTQTAVPGRKTRVMIATVFIDWLSC